MDDPDAIVTARSMPAMLRCEDCSADVCAGAIGEPAMCRACADTRRLLPRFLSLVRGRAHVRALLAEIDALDT